MNTHIRTRRRSQAALTALLAITLTAPTLAQPSITSLGVLPDHTSSNAYAVNHDGTVVVGISYSAETGFRAFRWRAGAMTDLGTLGTGNYTNGQGVSRDGNTVAGEALIDMSGTAAASRAFRWTDPAAGGAGLLSLGTLPGGTYSFAKGVSGEGDMVIGTSETPMGSRAFRWFDPAMGGNGLQSLGVIVGGFASLGAAISADGTTIVGYCGTSIGQRAFRWTDPGAGGAGMQNLGTLPPATPGGQTASFASAVSSDGAVIVGYSYIDSGGVSHPFRWTIAEETMEDLGTLGGDFVYANGVSGDGSIIIGADGSTPWLWTQADGMRSLTTALLDRGVDLTGWVLYAANAISEDGTAIVGDGAFNGEPRAWLVRLGDGDDCPADFNDSGAVDSSDFFAFLDAFFTLAPTADFDDSGGVDSSDFFAFLAAFFVGC